MTFSNASLDALRGGLAPIVAILTTYETRRAQLVAGPRLGVWASTDVIAGERERVQAELQALRDETRAALDAQRRQIGTRRDQVLAALDQAMDPRPTPTDSNAALLQETREQRAWQRVQPQLARGTASEALARAAELAQGAAAAGDWDLVDALQDELPAFLLGRGDERAAAAAGDELDAAIGRVAPEIAGLLSIRAEVERGCERLLVGIGQAEYSIAQGDTSVMLPGWGASDFQTVKLPPTAV